MMTAAPENTATDIYLRQGFQHPAYPFYFPSQRPIIQPAEKIKFKLFSLLPTMNFVKKIYRRVS